MKKLSDSDDNGQEVSSADVQNEVLKAWGNANPADILLGQFVNVDQLQRVQDGDPLLLSQNGLTVTARTVDKVKNLINLSIVSQIKEYSGDSTKVSSSETDYAVPDTSVPAANEQSQSVLNKFMVAQKDASVQPLALSVQTMLAYASICQKQENWDVTCHNLTSSDEVRPAPLAIQESDNCGGIPNCQIHVHKVSFDLILNTVEQDGTTSTQKVQYNLGFSPDVPFLARMVDNCRRLLVMVPSLGQKVLVSICDSVTDFKPGKKTDPP